MKQKRLLPYHVTISTYAQMRNVSRQAVYDKIRNGDISIDEVGYSNVKMIDLKKYKDIPFDNYHCSPLKIDLSVCRK